MSSDGSDDDIPGLESVSSSEVSGLKRESRDHNLSTSPAPPWPTFGTWCGSMFYNEYTAV